jgi:FkbM family methyltransferase
LSALAVMIGRLPRSWIKAASHAQWRNPAMKRVFDFVANRIRSTDGVIAQGLGRGLRFNTGRSNAGYLLGTSEPYVQRALATVVRPGLTFYDVGSNVGFHAMLAARLVGQSGHVICFEPFPDNANQIEYNACLNGFTNVRVRREALGNHDGSGRFLTSEEPTWGKLDSAGREPSRMSGEVQVAVRSLDSVVTEPPMPVPDVIKIDVEGGEVDVLTGAARTLREHRPILLIELHGTNAEVAEALESFGYLAGVLGSPLTIKESPWYAYVIAVPEENTETHPILGLLCRTANTGDRVQ